MSLVGRQARAWCQGSIFRSWQAVGATAHRVGSSRARGGLAAPSTAGQRGTAARAVGHASSLRSSRPGAEWTALPNPVPTGVRFFSGVTMGFRWDFDGRLMVVHGYRLRFSRRTAVRWILYFYMVPAGVDSCRFWLFWRKPVALQVVITLPQQRLHYLPRLLPIPPTYKLNGSSFGRPDVDLIFAKWAFNNVVMCVTA